MEKPEFKYTLSLFEDTGDVKINEQNEELFRGLKIMEEGGDYIGYIGRYPVINLTLKSAKQSVFESALKTNEYLRFAVITGCLRISKESIFTGLNLLNIISVLDKEYSEHFGFTESEVIKVMQHYNVESRFPTMKEWYLRDI